MENSDWFYGGGTWYHRSQPHYAIVRFKKNDTYRILHQPTGTWRGPYPSLEVAKIAFLLLYIHNPKG